MSSFIIILAVLLPFGAAVFLLLFMAGGAGDAERVEEIVDEGLAGSGSVQPVVAEEGE